MLDWSIVGDGAEEGAPDLSELDEGGIDGRSLELTPQREHVAEGGKVGRLCSHVDLESVVGVGHAVDGCDHRLDVVLCWQGGEV